MLQCGVVVLLSLCCVGGAQSILFSTADYCALLAQMTSTPGYVPPPGDLAAANAMMLDALAAIPEDAWPTWNVSRVQLQQLVSTLKGVQCGPADGVQGFPFHAFVPCLDGLVAAPASHALAWSAPPVQVVHWHLCAGCQEPYHTHVLASLTFDVFPAGIEYYNSSGQVAYTSPPTTRTSVMRVESQTSEWLHSIKNTDNHTYQVCVCVCVCSSRWSDTPPGRSFASLSCPFKAFPTRHRPACCEAKKKTRVHVFLLTRTARGAASASAHSAASSPSGPSPAGTMRAMLLPLSRIDLSLVLRIVPSLVVSNSVTSSITRFTKSSKPCSRPTSSLSPRITT